MPFPAHKKMDIDVTEEEPEELYQHGWTALCALYPISCFKGTGEKNIGLLDSLRGKGYYEGVLYLIRDPCTSSKLQSQ